MTIREAIELLQAEVTARPAAELSTLTVLLPCGDVGHEFGLTGIDRFPHAVSLIGPQLECCRVLEEQAVDGETHTPVAGMPFVGDLTRLQAVERRHEALRAAVMTIYSDPNLTWEAARAALAGALNAGMKPETKLADGKGPREFQGEPTDRTE